MSFLAPLYAAGILAVSLPILFHLVRRIPRERVAFSSLIFLSPSPLRVTRRSRLENLWLLFLRGLAICMLALAFARPFFRNTSHAPVAQHAGERVVLLVDSSASMRRDRLWDQAVQQVLTEVDQCDANDQVALVAFDSHIRPLITFSEWDNTANGSRRQMIRSALDDLKPSWRATHLDAALTAASDLLSRDAGAESDSTAAAKRIVLISDLQQGSRLTGLRAHRWPTEIEVSIATITPTATTNAGLQIVAPGLEDRHTRDAGTVRVRIDNAADSQRDRFQIGWVETAAESDKKPTSDNARIDVYVPAGQSRIVQAPPRPAEVEAAYLKLTGDDQEFDNVAYHVAAKPAEMKIWYLGDDTGEDPQKPRYFLERALADTPARHVEIIAPDETEFVAAPGDIAMAVVTAQPTAEQIATLQQFLSNGGTILYSLPSVAASEELSQLIGGQSITATEADTDTYAMLEDIQFDHPLFTSFSESRFSDFTKIRFWKHRRIDEAALPGAEILARFDDGAAALVDVPAGKGRLLLFTSGWHPEESQLALSSKFAPLLNAILERSAGISAELPAYYVGDAVVCTLDEGGGGEGEIVLAAPDAVQTQLAFNGRSTDATDTPGIYRFQRGDRSQAFAVNLPPQESKTAALPVEQLEQLGLVLQRTPTAAELAQQEQQQRQLKNRELESRQKLWHWLVLAALVVLILETWWAGRTARAAAPAA